MFSSIPTTTIPTVRRMLFMVQLSAIFICKVGVLEISAYKLRDQFVIHEVCYWLRRQHITTVAFYLFDMLVSHRSRISNFGLHQCAIHVAQCSISAEWTFEQSSVFFRLFGSTIMQIVILLFSMQILGFFMILIWPKIWLRGEFELRKLSNLEDCRSSPEERLQWAWQLELWGWGELLPTRRWQQGAPLAEEELRPCQDARALVIRSGLSASFMLCSSAFSLSSFCSSSSSRSAGRLA